MIPSRPGSASGLRNAPCSTAPDRPRPPPTSSASSVRGKPELPEDQAVRQGQRGIADQQRERDQDGQQQRQPADHCASSRRGLGVNGPAQMVSAGGIARRGMPASGRMIEQLRRGEGRILGRRGTTSRSGGVAQQRLQPDAPPVRRVGQTGGMQHRVHQRARSGGEAARLPHQGADRLGPVRQCRELRVHALRAAPRRARARREHVASWRVMLRECRQSPAAGRSRRIGMPLLFQQRERGLRPVGGGQDQIGVQPQHRLRRGADDRKPLPPDLQRTKGTGRARAATARRPFRARAAPASGRCTDSARRPAQRRWPRRP